MKTAYDIILTPVISEQSMDVAADKKYTFKVATDANKTQVKLAVEEIFGVEVEKVNIMNYDGKVKRMGRTWAEPPHIRRQLLLLLTVVRKSNSSRDYNRRKVNNGN